MDQSRETLQDRIKRIQDRNQQELLRDIVDSAWSWKGKDSAVATTDRWITVGGQTVRGTTAQEKAPETTGGQTDAQGQTTGAKGDKGDSGPAGPAGKDGKDGKDGIKGEDGAPGAPGTTLHAELTDLLGPGPEYTHLNAAQTLALTGGGDTNLHWHSADRARATHTGTQASATISDKGLAGGLATLDAGGRVPLNQLPATAIVTTSVVASQSAMLALTAEQGDVAVRTDLSKTFILKAEPASTLANWQELLSPSDGVQSVAMTATGPISVTGSPITNIGTFALTWSGSSSNLVRADGSVVASSSFQPAGSYQPLDADLTAISALATTGFVRRTAADTWAASALVWSDISGIISYGTTAGTVAQGNDSRILNGKTAYSWGNHASAGYALASSVPVASSTTPAALGSAAVGTGTTWARADHVHAMPTAAQVGALAVGAQAADSAKLGGQLPSYYATASSLGSYLPLAGGTMNTNASVIFNGTDNSEYKAVKVTGASWTGMNVQTTGGGVGAFITLFTPGGTGSYWAVQKRDAADYGTTVGCFAIEDNAAGATSARFPLWIAQGASGNINFNRNLVGTTASFSSRCTQAGYTIWDSGNLTGDQSAHYHSSDRAWGNITDVPAGVRAPWEYFQPLEDQRLRTTDSPSFSNITATGLAKVAALELSYGGSGTGTPRVTYNGINLSFYFNDVGTVPLYIDKSTLQAVVYKLNALNVVSSLTPYTGYLNVGVPSNPWNGVFSKKICLSAEVFSSNVDAQKSINNSYFEMLPSSRVTEVAIMPDSSTDYPAGTLLVIKGRNTGAEMLTQIKDVYRNIKAKDGSVLALANALYGLVGTKMFVRTNSLEWQEI